MQGKIKHIIIIPLYVIFILFVIGLLVFEIYYGQNNLKSKSITYTKESNVNYVTYLKDNSHYNDTFLKDDYSYVANLIDYFSLDYNYSYVLSEKIKYDLTYDVKAYLEVYDADNKVKPIEKKEIVILDKVNESKEGQLIKIDLFNQKVDYETYSNIIESWKKEVSPDATLKIVFSASWKGHSNTLNKEISDSDTKEFIIPISDKIINIAKPTSTSISSSLYANESLASWYLILVISTGMLLLIVMVFFINILVGLNKTKSKYDIQISKILREFDRAITEVKGDFVKEKGNNYIEVNNFMELMDVHDNLNEPIIYYKKENASTFVIRNGNDIYYTTISRKDFE